MTDLALLVRSVTEQMAQIEDRGAVATYIPPLAEIDPLRFGLCIVTADGAVHTAGDCDEPFSIQSVSKVFALTQALGKIGEALWLRVGREPSGTAFNSIVQLEREQGIPRNPFVNAGALVVADVNLAGHEPRVAIGELLRFVRYLADDDAIRSQPHRRLQQAAHVDGVGRMQGDRIVGDALQLGRVLEDDDAMVGRGGDHLSDDRVGERRLAGAGAAGDDNVHP